MLNNVALTLRNKQAHGVVYFLFNKFAGYSKKNKYKIQ